MTEGEGDGLWPEAVTERHHSSSGAHTPVTGVTMLGKPAGCLWTCATIWHLLTVHQAQGTCSAVPTAPAALSTPTPTFPTLRPGA